MSTSPQSDQIASLKQHLLLFISVNRGCVGKISWKLLYRLKLTWLRLEKALSKENQELSWYIKTFERSSPQCQHSSKWTRGAPSPRKAPHTSGEDKEQPCVQWWVVMSPTVTKSTPQPGWANQQVQLQVIQSIFCSCIPEISSRHLATAGCLISLPSGRATCIINQFSFKPIVHWCDLFQECVWVNSSNQQR